MNIDKTKKYEGYVWMSDCDKPDVLRDELLKVDFSTIENPFVIEAQLFDKESLTSYSVKFIDGEYHIMKFKLEEKDLLEPIHFVPKSRLDTKSGKVKSLKFKQLWKVLEEGDPLCEGMKTKVPTALVFIGFDFYNKEEE